jgi:hypothetical protein
METEWKISGRTAGVGHGWAGMERGSLYVNGEKYYYGRET